MEHMDCTSLSSGQASWRSGLEVHQSKGSTDEGAGSLAGLHEARKRHQGQFWTPLSVVSMLWRIAQEAFESQADRKITLLDNSMGSGRMWHFATADRFALAGCDVDAELVAKVQETAEAAGFTVDLHARGMEEVAPRGFDVALVNPPFSLSLQNPALKKYPCTTWGKFGPDTSAQSDEYAVCQALEAAAVVLAVVPSGLAADVVAGGLIGEQRQRLRAVLSLGKTAFSGEGAEVETSVLVFGRDKGEYIGRISVDHEDAGRLPKLGLSLQGVGAARMGPRYVEDSEPKVTLPVTGDASVRVTHSGRKIHLKFRCGLAQARVLNGVYRDRIVSTEHVTLPAGVKYAGQGLLDVESLLIHDDPEAELDRLAEVINKSGGRAVIESGLRNYVRRRARRKARELQPFGHWVYSKEFSESVEGVAVKNVPMAPKSWTSPVVKAGQTAMLHGCDEGWRLSWSGHERRFSDQDARALFQMPAISEGWVEVHKPLQEAFPAMARQLEVEAKRMGLDKMLWSFQFKDLIEVSMKPRGAVVGWRQGLGKARLAAALIMLRRVKHGLCVMPAYLVREFGKRLESAGIPDDQWQIITSPEHVKCLRLINVISYERLRMSLKREQVEEVSERDPAEGDADGESKPAEKRRRIARGKTYAKALRHRIGLVVNDEGEVLANRKSDRSRAVAQVAAGVGIVSTGTPCPNYPRDLLPIGAYCAGDGTPAQPFGINHPMLETGNSRSMEFSERGIEAFGNRHVVTEWVTNVFKDTLSEGAKREVPKIAGLSQYREWVSRFVKRRVHREPEVEACVKIEDPIIETVTEEWDEEHLAHYIKVADEFVQWYENHRKDKKATPLQLLLARIGAVEGACNIPQRNGVNQRIWTGGVTSKQRAVVREAVGMVRNGHKVVCFAHSPRMLDILQKSIEEQGVETVMFNGEVPSKRRHDDLDLRFREGSAGVLLASYGCAQAGLDLYQADRAILASRDWAARTEDQAIRRLLRPQQQKEVVVRRVHLRGSIDEYQDQLCKWKETAAASGIDWGEPMPDDVEFQHLDTLLGMFIEDLAGLRGMKGHELRDALKEAA